MDKSKNPTGTSPVLGDASNSIADKQLREAIHKLLDSFTEPGTGEKYLKDLEQDLLALFHTYGNRERIDEIKSLKTKKVKGAELVEMKWIDKRIAKLNREVEITDEDIKKGWPRV